MNGNQKGFTLIEISIVLVIIGLLVGGIIGGREMIQVAKLNSIIKEKSQFEVAVNTFQAKYGQLPGDMRNAEDFWGIANATDADCVTTDSTGVTTTCNGDGDGLIEEVTGAANEKFRFWQHLSNARLVDGTFSGRTSGAANERYGVPGENVPEPKYGIGAWHSMNLGGNGAFGGDTVYYATTYRNLLSLGAERTNFAPDNPLLTPADAWFIDNKLDDGLPGRGTIIAIRWDSCTDAADNTGLDADYLLQLTGAQCAIAFVDIW